MKRFLIDSLIHEPLKLIILRTLLMPASLFLVNSLFSQPTASIYGESVSKSSVFEVYFSFSDSVVGFTASDVVVTNGSAVSVAGEGRYYSAAIESASPGIVTVSLPAGAVMEKGGSQTNTATGLFSASLIYDVNMITWKINSDSDWAEIGSQSSGLNFADGEARPTGETAQYASITKTFPIALKPRKIIFKQSPIWENWTESSENVGPGGAGGAPIFLSVADNDYYFFGVSSDIYTAWHSTDMVNWVKYKPLYTGPQPPGNHHHHIGRWVTSAEYKDGNFYILSDVPNDEDPHLFFDDDLNDDTPATYSDTAVFHDPSHGSDAALFRSDEDGLFHIIYEDWTPVNARARSGDSPLAGHTSSEDCINGFIPHEHAPPVDRRTTPTGETGTFIHQTDRTYTYYIHEPEQDVFGDWNVLKVGSQLYLFSDYDPAAGGDMCVAVHTSRSIYKPFEFVNTVGTGHPDPTSGFAEGKFYLITQKADYISPGPWVEQVEARAGVDVDSNGTIDNWTEWQDVKETYNHKPGYARVVDATPAELDISSLPEGKGFKFEFRITDKTENASTPIIDYVEMSFDPPAASVNAQGGAQGAAFRIITEGKQHKLYYEVSEAGLAKFSLYNPQGKIVHTLKRHHSMTGPFTLTLDNEVPSWKVIEYTSPAGIIKRGALTR